MSFLKITTLAVAAAAALASAAPARADIISALAAAPTATGDGFFSYTYNLSLSTQSELNAVAPGIVPEFGTIYDFGRMALNPATGTPYGSGTGLVAGSVSGISFNFTFNNSDTPAFNSTPPDNPTLANIRFTYTGTNNIKVMGDTNTFTNPNAPTTIIAAGDTNLGTFTIYSPYGTLDPAKSYDGQTYKPTNNTVQGNNGQLSGPLLPTSVPEPASLALLGMGLVGAGVIRRRVK